MEKETTVHPCAPHTSNRTLLLYYLAPYALYVLIPFTTESQEAIYALRLSLVPVALAVCWRRYIPLTGPKSIGISMLWGAMAGLFGCALWVGLSIPFAPQDIHAPWTPRAFFLRLAAATLLVPVFEEYLLRGYFFRLALQWQRAKKKGSHSPLSEALDDCNVAEIAPGDWSLSAIFLSSLLFALGHRPFEWSAALVYGVLLSVVWIRRKDMISLVSAHAVTNVSLALYVRHWGHWTLW
ncbi:CPBP family glutamic-type intramembrane protease [Desulfoluna butyratoxydans]|uniref:Caax amino terminal protease n=1 Tax=Desulfoluna butyratoxydans TaxID=231438 RepID=A0A4U8YRD8_9BACT|nr:CPBP family glutamic-type intramembrane protease [Desulfoluna butyratoxydans]VFQ44352.1 caax amino terminal protease [Desulfoluna butyratoxydans]